MKIQVYPLALGRTDTENELHAWDPDCGLSEVYAGVSSIEVDCNWGAGVIEEEPSLVLYLFNKEHTIEVYFPNRISVGPERWMNSWDVLLSMRPETLVLAYGEKPTDTPSRLKIKCETSGFMKPLYNFVDHLLEMKPESGQHSALVELTNYFAAIHDVNGNDRSGVC